MKKSIALLLSLAILLNSSTVAAAAPAQQDNGGAATSVLSEGTVIYHAVNGAADISPNGALYYGAPRFQLVRIISSSISESGGKATCTGSVGIYNTDNTVTLTLTLERSKDGSNWSEVKSWTSDPTSGRSRVVMEKSYYINKGYSYRVITTAEVESTLYLETVECESNILYY